MGAAFGRLPPFPEVLASLGIMRRGFLIVLVAGALAGTAAAQTKPTLRLLAQSPLTVRGVGFHAKEKVRVTVAVSSVKRVRVVRTTAAGAFTVEISNVTPYDPCNDTLRVNAAGAIGDTAVLKLPQRACPPSP
jgi:hypothetical protein